MAKQFDRKATLLIGLGDRQKEDILDLSQLHFYFEVTDVVQETLGSLFVKIYNPSQETRQRIIDEGDSIILAAGYDGSFGEIFQGTIIQAWYGHEDGCDSFVIITALDGNREYNETFVSKTISAGSTRLGRLNDIAKAGGMLEPRIDGVVDNGERLARGRVYFGLARDHIRPLAASLGSDWNIKDGQINVVPQGKYLPGDIPEINAATGMIDQPIQTFEGLQVRTLLNPNIIPGIKFHINNASILQQQADLGLLTGDLNNTWIPSLNKDGFYKVIYHSHIGDNRGGDWYTDIIGMDIESSLLPQQLGFEVTMKNTRY